MNSLTQRNNYQAHLSRVHHALHTSTTSVTYLQPPQVGLLLPPLQGSGGSFRARSLAGHGSISRQTDQQVAGMGEPPDWNAGLCLVLLLLLNSHCVCYQILLYVSCLHQRCGPVGLRLCLCAQASCSAGGRCCHCCNGTSRNSYHCHNRQTWSSLSWSTLLLTLRTREKGSWGIKDTQKRKPRRQCGGGRVPLTNTLNRELAGLGWPAHDNRNRGVIDRPCTSRDQGGREPHMHKVVPASPVECTEVDRGLAGLCRCCRISTFHPARRGMT